MDDGSSAVTLALLGQKLDVVERQCSNCAERVRTAMDQLDHRTADIQERVRVLEEWRTAVDHKLDFLQEKFDSISNRLWLVFGGIIAVLITALANLLMRTVKGG